MLHRLSGCIRIHRPALLRVSFLSSAPPRLLTTEPPAFVADLIQPSETGDPLWSISDLTSDPHRQKTIRQTLVRHSVDEFEFLRWRNFLVAPSIQDALEHLEHGLHPTPSIFTHEDRHAARRIPGWLLHHLVANKCHSPSDVISALDLVKAHMEPHIDGALTPAASISLAKLCIRSISRYNVLSALPAVIGIFAGTSSAARPSREEIIAVLHDVAGMPSSSPDSRQVINTSLRRILGLLYKCGHTLDRDTYMSIIRRPTLSPSLLKFFRDRFQLRGSDSELHGLQLLSRSYAKHGCVLEVKRLLARSSALDTTADSPRPVSPHYNKLDRPDSDPSTPSYPQAITPLNISLITTFANDRRARDPARVPSALLSYFARLQRAAGDASPDTVKNMWSAFVVALSTQAGFSASRLLGVLQVLEAREVQLSMTAYTAVVRGLVRRAEIRSALEVWESNLAPLGDALDLTALTAGVKVLAEAGHLVEAFDLFDRIALRPGSTASPDSLRKIRLDSALMSDFMLTLVHSDRADVAYVLWDHMEQLYGVRPNDTALNCILITAASASRRNRAPGMLDLLGWRKKQSSALPDVRALLAEERKARGFWWGDTLAWERAATIFREVVLGNYPHLATLEPPAYATSDPAGGFEELLSRHQASVASAPSTRPYYDIVPSKRTFHAYVRLLCMHGQAALIPQALSWQRALRITPARHTLRLALLHFAEVGSGSPIADARGLRSEYERLREWMVDWVGEADVPSEKEVGITRAKAMGAAVDFDVKVEERRKRWRIGRTPRPWKGFKRTKEQKRIHEIGERRKAVQERRQQAVPNIPANWYG